MKKTISLLLTVVLIFTMAIPVFAEGFDNFESTESYYDGKFYDVPVGRWYTENVRSACELGIMQGMSSNSFSPEGTLTCVQTIVMACRIHSIYNGIDYDFSSGSPYWYSPYLEYADSYGIISVWDEYLNVPVDRETFAVILGSSLPDNALPEINYIEDGIIPDIGYDNESYTYIYRLYRAGILTGNDGYGTFAPASNITRGEAAAIVSRMAKPSLRKYFTLMKEPTNPGEIIVVDNADCLIKITGTNPDHDWGYTINAYFENRSSTKTYMFSVESAAINGVQVDPAFATEILPGKKSNEEISFYGFDLYNNAIGRITDVELNFIAYDSNDWSSDYIANKSVNIYPFGKENAVKYYRAIRDTDTVIVNNDSISAIVTGYRYDDIFGYTADLYLVNKTDKELMFAEENASVNDFMAEPYWARTLLPGKSIFTSMSWSDDILNKNNIDSVDKIEMLFYVYDNNDWDSYDIFNKVITLYP